MSNIYDKQDDLISTLNELKGYTGYVQFSNRRIEEKDVFRGRDVNIDLPEKDTLLYEAHFFSKDEKKSISVRYINGRWYLDETSTAKATGEDIQSYQSHHGVVRMAQIWEPLEDENCNGFKAMKLTKVVFAGFKKGGES